MRARRHKKTSTMERGGVLSLRLRVVIPIHPPVQTCYKFAFAMALHSVCVFPRSLTFRTKKIGNLEKNAQSTIPGSASTCQAMDFFVGSANAPRRALGRQNATFSLVTPHWSGVYAAKRPRIIAENTAKIAKKKPPAEPGDAAAWIFMEFPRAPARH